MRDFQFPLCSGLDKEEGAKMYSLLSLWEYAIHVFFLGILQDTFRELDGCHWYTNFTEL